MASVASKKDGSAQASKRQTKLGFERTIKAPISSPHLTQLLSQYQLLQAIAGHLSSADIAHLAATSKEHRSYMMDGEHIFRQMKFSALCDGKGLEARANCFGHFEGDVKNATVKCQEDSGMPCDGCKAMVCNNCRYHVNYHDIPCCQEDMFHYEEHEIEYASALESIRAVHQGHCDDCPAFHSGNVPIEAIRAVNLAGEPRERHFCDKAGCEPPVFEGKSVFDVLMDTEDTDIATQSGWCKCDISTEFVEDRWLCIPCFFDKEVKAYARRTSRIIFLYNKEKQDGKTIVTREYLKTEDICDCGEVANILGYTECRWCELPIRPEHLDQVIEDFF